MFEKILIVDDDEDIRVSLADILKGEKYKIEEASTTEEALMKAKIILPDIVLLDIHLKDIKKENLSRKIKDITRGRAKIIIYTADSGIADNFELQNFEADDYVIKTEDVDKLLEKIKILKSKLC